MAEYYKRVVPTGNDVVDAIIFDYRWTSSNLTYGFRVQDIDDNGIADFDEGDWKSFYVSIFDNISSFARLDFREVDFENAQLNQLMGVGGGGQSSNVGPGLPTSATGVPQTYTQVDISGPVAAAAENIYLGKFSEFWQHEIGHSLGLRHSFEISNKIDDGVTSEDALGTHFLSSDLYTVMTYATFFWGEDNPWTPAYDAGKTLLNAGSGTFMPIDIAALQHIYGKRDHNTGDDLYAFGDDPRANTGYRTIWDTGGSDTIEYTGTSRARIDLHAATLRKEIGGGGFLSTSETLTGGFLIAKSVAIENAVGGGNDDILIGNVLANRLTGNGGDDWLEGGAGRDTLTGGAGGDRFVFDNLAISGVDRITDFQPGDRLLVTRALADANGDGFVTFGRNGVLNLDSSSRGDKVILDGVDPRTGLVYLGVEDGYYVYALNDGSHVPAMMG